MNPSRQSHAEPTAGWGPSKQGRIPASTQGSATHSPEERALRREISAVFMNHVFGWMAAALALSGVVAAMVLSSEQAWNTVSNWFFPLVLAELGLVIALSAALHKMSATTAAALFLVYAALNGLTLAVVVALYTATSVAKVFFITAGGYGAMAMIGITTKKDLSGMGGFLMMGLVSLLIAFVVNYFLASSALDWALSVVGVLLFAGLTAYDVQRFKRLGYMGFSSKQQAGRMAIHGALNLYLDFINLFLMLLRLFGDRR